MGLYLRSSSLANSGNTLTIQGTALTYDQADGNFVYLLTNMSGSNIRITGSTGIIGNTIITGSLSVSSTVFATASWATNALTASYVTSSKVFGPNGANSILSASYAFNSLSSSFATIAISSSRPIAVTGSTIYSTAPLSTNNPNTSDSIFLGTNAGDGAINASYSNFIGLDTGYQATNALDSTFIGNSAGYQASEAVSSIFLGNSAGYEAYSASYSVFLGNSAGDGATNASYSIFIGRTAGNTAESASYSTIIGYAAGRNKISSNNIIIGTNITLANGTKDSINLGGIIFATGSYSTTLGAPFSGSMTAARVGIATQTPQFTLDVSGSTRITNNLIVSGNITLGDATTDTITLNAATMSLAGSIFQIISGSNTLATLNDIGKFTVSSGSEYKSIALDPSGSRINYFQQGSYNTYIDFRNGDFTYINSSGNKNFIAGANNITADILSSGLNSTYAALTLKSTLYGVSTTTPAIDFIVFETDGGSNNLSKLQIYNGDDGNVILLPHMPISGGYVGIGTTTPSASLHVSGAARIDDVLTLPYQHPLPSGKPTGSIALSGSGGTFEGMYVYNGTSWTKVGP